MGLIRKDNPYSTFYWKDYENDEALKISSLAAQGLWMRLLCVAAKASPVGHLLVNGTNLEIAGIARIAGVTETEAETLMEELERNGVFSHDRKGRIYSRRMVRDHAKSQKNRKIGQKGGNPRLSASPGNATEKTTSVNPPVNPLVNPPYPCPIPEEDSVAVATGGLAADLPADDGATKAIFDRGVKYLIEHGTSEKLARSVIGKWRQHHTDTDIYDAFVAAKRAEVVEPVAWISARLSAALPQNVDALMANINPDGTIKNANLT